MVHITIIAVGKLKERYWVDACEEYLKRLGAYAQVRVIEVADIDPDRVGGEKEERKREGEAILDAIPKHAHVILLDVHGKQTSSEHFALEMEELMLLGDSEIAFIIGGSTGVSNAVKLRAHKHMSFGPITLPHNLARVVLLEQIYRAFKILKKEPYHK